MARDYGQFCGLARALELVGGRWALLIVRDLMTGPKRFKDLQVGLAGIPSNVLSSRLHELEDAGIIERRLLERPSNAVGYVLTSYGRGLEDAVVQLGLWGSQSLGKATPADCFSAGAFTLALRGAFRPERAKDYEILVTVHLGGQALHVSVRQGRVAFPNEVQNAPDVVVTAAPDVLARILAGQLDLDLALGSGQLRIEGSRRQGHRFFEIFRLPSRVGASA